MQEVTETQDALYFWNDEGVFRLPLDTLQPQCLLPFAQTETMEMEAGSMRPAEGRLYFYTSVVETIDGWPQRTRSSIYAFDPASAAPQLLYEETAGENAEDSVPIMEPLGAMDGTLYYERDGEILALPVDGGAPAPVYTVEETDLRAMRLLQGELLLIYEKDGWQQGPDALQEPTEYSLTRVSLADGSVRTEPFAAGYLSRFFPTETGFLQESGSAVYSIELTPAVQSAALAASPDKGDLVFTDLAAADGVVLLGGTDFTTASSLWPRQTHYAVWMLQEDGSWREVLKGSWWRPLFPSSAD